MKLCANIHYVSGDAEKLFKVRGQRWRSGSDSHVNVANLIAREPLKGSEQKFTKTLTIVGRRTDYRTFSRWWFQRSRSQKRGSVPIDASPSRPYC